MCYGTTLGNSLRCILLSSLQVQRSIMYKLMVYCMNSTVPGVVEDVTVIVLMRSLKIHSEDVKTLELDIEGQQLLQLAISMIVR